MGTITPLYFNHIPKTAGTSVTAWLRSQPGRVAPAWLWSHLLKLPRESLRDYSIFAGHFFRPFHKYYSGKLATVVFLRNPIDRSISHFSHILRAPEHYLHERVQRHRSFMEFITDPVSRPVVENYQVRALVNEFDPVSLRDQISPDGYIYSLERAIDCMRLQYHGPTALRIAKDYLLRCVVVGITELSDHSISLLSSKMGWRGGGRLKRENVSPHHDLHALAISDRELEAVCEATALDWELYQFGRTLLLNELSLVSYQAGGE